MIPANPLPETALENQLRALAGSYGGQGHYDAGMAKLFTQAADEISLLRFDNHRMRQLLRESAARRRTSV